MPEQEMQPVSPVSPDVPPAVTIALWADRMRDMAAAGVRYAGNIYERERAEAILEIAMEMAAYATGVSSAALEPLRHTWFARHTPFSVGDAAVIDDAGRLLLIQRADNRCWAMPGGALNAGETPSAGVLRESLEETGVAAEAVALAGVWTSHRIGAPTAVHLCQMVFLCRPLPVAPVEPSHRHESLAIGWFAEDELPADLDPNHQPRIPEIFAFWRGERPPYFDLP